MPKQEDDSVDRLFRSLLDLRSKPGKNVWENIETSINAKKSKRRLVAFWSISGVAVCALFLAVSGMTGPWQTRTATKQNSVVADSTRSAAGRLSRGDVSVRGKSGFSNILPTSVLPWKKSAVVPANSFDGNSDIQIGNARNRNPSKDRAINVGAKTFVSSGSATKNIRTPACTLPGIVRTVDTWQTARSALDLKKLLVENNIPVRQQKKFDHWSVIGYFSQELAGYSLADHDGQRLNGHETEKKERNIFSASAGFFVNYAFHYRWILQSGLNYSWSRSILNPGLSFAVKSDAGNVNFKVSTNTGFGYFPKSGAASLNVGDSAMTDKVYSKLAYVSMPIVFSRVFTFRRFRILAGAGGSVNFLTSSTIETRISEPTFEQTSTEVLHGLKKTIYGIIVKAEIHYALDKKWNLAILPAFKSALSPINMQTPQSVSPYNFGLGLGAVYKL